MVVLILATRRDNGLDSIQLNYSKVNSPLTETKVKPFWGDFNKERSNKVGKYEDILAKDDRLRIIKKQVCLRSKKCAKTTQQQKNVGDVH